MSRKLTIIDFNLKYFRAQSATLVGCLATLFKLMISVCQMQQKKKSNDKLIHQDFELTEKLRQVSLT